MAEPGVSPIEEIIPELEAIRSILEEVRKRTLENSSTHLAALTACDDINSAIRSCQSWAKTGGNFTTQPNYEIVKTRIEGVGELLAAHGNHLAAQAASKTFLEIIGAGTKTRACKDKDSPEIRKLLLNAAQSLQYMATQFEEALPSQQRAWQHLQEVRSSASRWAEALLTDKT